jgi:carboxymethylenebutenolidase
MTKDLRCPLLGLFGAEDRNPTPEHVKLMEQELTAHAKTFEFHTYDDAGHAFFSVDRPSYRVEAANDGWRRILAFYRTHLAVPA